LIACRKLAAGLLTCALALAACADITRKPSPLQPAAAAEPNYILAATVEVEPVGGRSRTLKEQSAWIKVGTVAEGTVFKPRDGGLTAEAYDVHEAYIVVRDGTCVGFWLPFEKTFVAQSKTVPLQLARGN
jgi:hypothetical protein